MNQARLTFLERLLPDRLSRLPHPFDGSDLYRLRTAARPENGGVRRAARNGLVCLLAACTVAGCTSAREPAAMPPIPSESPQLNAVTNPTAAAVAPAETTPGSDVGEVQPSGPTGPSADPAGAGSDDRSQDTPVPGSDHLLQDDLPGGDAPPYDELPGEPGTAKLLRLTEPGCCVGPFWAADSRSVQFIDRPSPDAAAGIWAVSVGQPASAPHRVVDQVANFSADLAYRIDLEDDTTTLTRLADGQHWTVPADGRPISISPGGRQIAWQANPPDVPEERRTSRVWVANLDGSGAREVAALPRGAISGWLTEESLLLRSRDNLTANEDVLWALSLADGSRRELARAERLRGELVAPGGAWVVYYVAQNPTPAANGLWLTSASGGAPRRVDPTLFGAYRWRDGGRLLLVPLRADSSAHELFELTAASLASRRLTDSATVNFKIANGDWSVSPDGSSVAFVESRDKAIWVVRLPATP